MGVVFGIEAGHPPILRIEGDAESLRKVARILERAADNGGATASFTKDGEHTGDVRILRLDTPSEKPPAGCPLCGATTGIYSKYRDGGSTLYHASCPVDPTHSWPNPDFAFGKKNPPGRVADG